MQALCLYLHTVLFVFQIWENEIVAFGWNLLLPKFGSEKVERSLSPYRDYLFLKELAIALSVTWYEESFHGNRLI